MSHTRCLEHPMAIKHSMNYMEIYICCPLKPTKLFWHTPWPWSFCYAPFRQEVAVPKG